MIEGEKSSAISGQIYLTHLGSAIKTSRSFAVKINKWSDFRVNDADLERDRDPVERPYRCADWGEIVVELQRFARPITHTRMRFAH